MWSNIIILLCIINIGASQNESSCVTKEDCAAFTNDLISSTCLNNVCICYDGRVSVIPCNPVVKLKHKSEIKSHKIGKHCPCGITHSHCDKHSNVCVCKENYTASFDNKRCIRRVVPLGGKCEDDSQCNSFDVNSGCSVRKQVCICTSNYTNVNGSCQEMMVSALPAVSEKAIGELCEMDQECQLYTNNTFCDPSINRCICKPEFVIKSDNKECLPDSDFGEACIETNQCCNKLGPGGICDKGICFCDIDHIENKSSNESEHSCVKKILIGSECNENRDCYYAFDHIQGMSCTLGQCVCLRNFEERNNFCVQKNAGRQLFSNFIVQLCITVNFFFYGWLLNQ